MRLDPFPRLPPETRFTVTPSSCPSCTCVTIDDPWSQTRNRPFRQGHVASGDCPWASGGRPTPPPPSGTTKRGARPDPAVPPTPRRHPSSAPGGGHSGPREPGRGGGGQRRQPVPRGRRTGVWPADIPPGPRPTPRPRRWRTDRATDRRATAAAAPPLARPPPAAHLARDLVQRVVLCRQPLPVGEPLAPRALRAHVHPPRRPLLPRGPPLPPLAPLSGRPGPAPPLPPPRRHGVSGRGPGTRGHAGGGHVGPGARRHAGGWRGRGLGRGDTSERETRGRGAGDTQERVDAGAGGAATRRSRGDTGAGAGGHVGAGGTRVLGRRGPAGTPEDVDRGAGTSEEGTRGPGTGDLRGPQGWGRGDARWGWAWDAQRRQTWRQREVWDGWGLMAQGHRGDRGGCGSRWVEGARDRGGFRGAGRPGVRSGTGGRAPRVVVDHRLQGSGCRWSWDLCWGAGRLLGIGVAEKGLQGGVSARMWLGWAPPHELESGSRRWGQRQTLGSGPGPFRSTHSYQTVTLASLLSFIACSESSCRCMRFLLHLHVLCDLPLHSWVSSC